LLDRACRQRPELPLLSVIRVRLWFPSFLT
jgi:hypothetical protein